MHDDWSLPPRRRQFSDEILRWGARFWNASTMSRTDGRKDGRGRGRGQSNSMFGSRGVIGSLATSGKLASLSSLSLSLSPSTCSAPCASASPGERYAMRDARLIPARSRSIYAPAHPGPVRHAGRDRTNERTPSFFRKRVVGQLMILHTTKVGSVGR